MKDKTTRRIFRVLGLMVEQLIRTEELKISQLHRLREMIGKLGITLTKKGV